LLLSYLTSHRPGDQSPDSPLFVRIQQTKKVTPLHRASVYKMVVYWAAQAGIQKRITPHSCRATLATLLHEKGVPIVDIQMLLGHKNIETTVRYVKAIQGDLNEVGNGVVPILK
jgi:integrase/recombinase XerD